MFEDRVLIWRFKRGSREAFRCIYDKYFDDLLTLAIHLLHDGSAAEDVVQDVFISFVQSIRTFHPNGRLKGYLTTCVANRARDRMRTTRRRRVVGLDQAGQVSSTTVGPPQSAIGNEESQRLRRALAGIPCEQREVIILRLHGDMRFRRIAVVQGVSIKTVQSRYRYGLDKLRSLLDGKVNNETGR